MTARELIVKVDEIARGKGFNQTRWSTLAGHAVNGQTVSRIISKGDCRVSTLIHLLDAIGCTLEIKENEQKNDYNA